ncbi:hypothetical protein E2C01_040568 [Portunus trituberculatus]|uniref:Uncharacterized protein n=1 Tax=Portunus trituberculatus TaxID=210409 RepID=A0A5B7FPJ6_PORTR|nr:hypothetical protein [Portunus trituberculatus]
MDSPEYCLELRTSECSVTLWRYCRVAWAPGELWHGRVSSKALVSGVKQHLSIIRRGSEEIEALCGCSVVLLMGRNTDLSPAVMFSLSAYEYPYECRFLFLSAKLGPVCQINSACVDCGGEGGGEGSCE